MSHVPFLFMTSATDFYTHKLQLSWSSSTVNEPNELLDESLQPANLHSIAIPRCCNPFLAGCPFTTTPGVFHFLPIACVSVCNELRLPKETEPTTVFTHCCCRGVVHLNTVFTHCCCRGVVHLNTVFTRCCRGVVHLNTVFTRCCGVLHLNTVFTRCRRGVLHLNTVFSRCCRGVLYLNTVFTRCCGVLYLNTVFTRCCRGVVHLNTVFTRCCGVPHLITARIVHDAKRPLFSQFQKLRSGRRYKVPIAGKNVYPKKTSFIPSAISILNS